MLFNGTMLNPDNRIVKDIKKQIKQHNGYCPLKLEKTADTKCPCLDYRTTGDCECGLYIKDISSMVTDMFSF